MHFRLDVLEARLKHVMIESSSSTLPELDRFDPMMMGFDVTESINSDGLSHLPHVDFLNFFGLFFPFLLLLF